jgi:hypothetical protein
MTAFSPTTTTIDPPGPSDELAGAVLAGLSRPILRRAPWGIVKTLVLSILTCGLWPLLSWPARFREACLREQQQLWHLAEWMRLNSGRPDAAALRDSTRALAFRKGLQTVAWVVIFIGVMAPLHVLPPHTHLPFPVFYHSMYSHSWFVDAPLVDNNAWGVLGTSSVDPWLVKFAQTWSGLLTIALVLHWFQLQLHIGDVRMYLTRFNAITGAHGIKPIRMPHTGIGLRPMWVIAGIAGACLGVPWMLPLMIVGAVQNRYIGQTSYIVRHEMAQVMQPLVNRQNPGVVVPTPMRLWGCCLNPQCGAIIPPAAKFCPRCGTTAPRRV